MLVEFNLALTIRLSTLIYYKAVWLGPYILRTNILRCWVSLSKTFRRRLDPRLATSACSCVILMHGGGWLPWPSPFTQLVRPSVLYSNDTPFVRRALVSGCFVTNFMSAVASLIFCKWIKRSEYDRFFFNRPIPFLSYSISKEVCQLLH